MLLLCAALAASCATADDDTLKRANETLAVMTRVADWQLENPSKHNPLDWTHGALYAGYMALDGLVADTRYRDAVFAVGKNAGWKNWGRTYHADDYAVGQSYAEIYLLYRDPDIAAPTKTQFEIILSNPLDVHVGEIRHGRRTDGRDDTPMRWWWCDALFMAPPVWAKLYDITDDAKYLDFMIKEWKATSEFLFDKEEHLYFRDKNYFPDLKKEANGKKIFWGRGNGWVLGGLVRVLQVLPDNHPERPFFVEQFQQMCRKLIAIQPADGVWRASLLDPDSYPNPEASGTGFITYALAWGINQGLLTKEEAEPAMRRAWAQLCSFVTPEGKLTHVQPIGADPKTFPVEATEVYGVGAFLMAGSEIYRMDLLRAKPHATFTVKNPSDVFLPQHTVEIDWKNVLKKLPDAKPETLAFMDGTNARWLTTQILPKVFALPLLFQTDLHAQQTREFIIVSGMDTNALPRPVLRTTARFVPERMDDFAWENDRTAYRAYGPALWEVDGAKPGKPAATGNGIDVWGKNDRLPVVDRMYKEKNYHAPDLGYGIDCYKVGTGPGCGGSAIFADGKYWQAITYKDSMMMAGPIRTAFTLSYAPFDVGGKQVQEDRFFRIDLGSDFYSVDSSFTIVDAVPATCISYRPVDAASVAKGKGWIAVWEPAQDNLPFFNGVAVVVEDGEEPVIQGEAAWVNAGRKTGNFGWAATAYAGSCWSGGKDYKTAADWFAAVERFRERLGVRVEIK
ncbi:MAG: glycoside hydrolase family 88 protein [Kiritimatiellaeota bacterium]|nr:glycoside hydrolase family 88 protein [Kiritimatiellota bacterium]